MSVDRELVERITRQVMERLGDTAGASSSGSSGAGSGTRRLLVVLGSGTTGLDEAVEQIRRAAANFGEVTLFITRCSESAGTDKVFSERIPSARVLRVSGGANPDDCVGGSSAVVFPFCTMTTAAKIGLLVSDSSGPTIAVSALQKGIPLIIATNSIMSGFTGNPAFQSVGDEHVSRMNRVGATTCDVRELASRISGGSAGAVSTGHSAAPARPTPSATIECRPVVDEMKAFLMSALSEHPACAAVVRSAIDKCVEAGACRVGTDGVCDPDAHSAGAVAGMIDHTLLKPNATPHDIEKLCEEARKHHFKSVCVNPQYVSLSKRLLQGSGVLVCTVVGFPLGATTASAKAGETRDAIADGADEIDMVINIGALKAGEYEKVKHDVESVVEAARGRTVKVILETSLLTDEEKVAGCQLSVSGGADFVKTSTGFGGGGATPEDIALMRKVVGPNIGVKASGGVRTKEDAEKLIAAGATRLGASASIAIATGQKSSSKGY